MSLKPMRRKSPARWPRQVAEKMSGEMISSSKYSTRQSKQERERERERESSCAVASVQMIS